MLTASEVEGLIIEHCQGSKSTDLGLLITGEWGSGKTTFVRSLLDRNQVSPKPIYISLYGKESIAALKRDLFLQLYPLLNNKFAKGAWSAGKKALRFRQGFDLNKDANPDVEFDFSLGDLAIETKLNKVRGRSVILDDFERSKIPINSQLGFCHKLLDEFQVRLIAIANEKKFISKADYVSSKEKIFGWTIELPSQIDVVIGSFFEQIKNISFRNFCVLNRAQLVDTFKQTGSSNLRVLRQALRELERFAEFVTKEQFEQSANAQSLFKTLLALLVESKLGRLTTELLQSYNVWDKAVRLHNKDESKSPQDEISERYNDIDVFNTLDRDFLDDFLFRGWVDEQTVQAALKKSRFFKSIEKQPTWVQLWHMHRLSEVQFFDVLKAVQAQFNKREFKEVGEILHVVGMLLSLARNGILDYDLHLVEKLAKQYVDDLVASEQVAPLHFPENLEKYQGFSGLGLHDLEHNEIRNFWSYMNDRRLEEGKRVLPILAEELSVLIEENVKEFCSRLGNGVLCEVSVLHLLDSKHFSIQLCSIQSDELDLVKYQLRQRYHLNSTLFTEERSWLRGVSKEIRSRLAGNRTNLKLRMEYFLENYIDPYI